VNKKNIWVILATVVLITALTAGVLIFQTKSNKQNAGVQNIKAVQNNQNPIVIEQLLQKEITLTTTGFAPQTLTIKPGTRIVWLNQSGVTGTVNSDNYPTNTLYPFLNFGRFDDKSSVSVMFTKLGKYTYYNALNLNQKGTITVE
jgi:plastocyanin